MLFNIFSEQHNYAKSTWSDVLVSKREVNDISNNFSGCYNIYNKNLILYGMILLEQAIIIRHIDSTDVLFKEKNWI